MTVENTPGVDRADDPPVNPSGEFVYGRATDDGTPCSVRVPLPYVTCHQHERSDPIVTDG